MVKLLFKIIWYVIVVLAFVLLVYFLFENQGAGIQNLKDVFSSGFVEGIKEFFLQIWNGIKAVCGIK